LYGTSSGAVLALKAAAKLGRARVTKLVLYAPPLSFGEEAIEEFAQYTQKMNELLKANQPGDALALFLADMMPPDALEEMRQSPQWTSMEAVAHTLAYDNAIMGDGALPTDAARKASMPTLIMDGSEGADFIHEAAEGLAKAMPHARRATHEGQTHGAAPEVLAPILVEFFTNSPNK
jgi:pimeloyl-ACP methyl ester carboxylesterase